MPVSEMTRELQRLQLRRLVPPRDCQAGGVSCDAHGEEEEAEHSEHLGGPPILRTPESDREKPDRHQVRDQPHVGISRAEHRPRQDHEEDREDDGREGQVARQRQLAAHNRIKEYQRRRPERREVEQLPAVAQGRIDPAPLHLPFEPAVALPAVSLAAPDEHDQ